MTTEYKARLARRVEDIDFDRLSDKAKKAYEEVGKKTGETAEQVYIRLATNKSKSEK